MTGKNRWLLPEGIEELLPAEAEIAEAVRRRILDVFRGWGYRLVMPPLVEFTDSLLIGLGDDVALQSFRLTDQQSGKPMAIRADITPQAARIDAHSMRATGVNRLCYAGTVLYTRPKTLLGSRCPIQAGAELYGDGSINADIEMTSLMLDMLGTVGAGGGTAATPQGLTLDLGHMGIYRAVVEAMQARQPELDEVVLEQFGDAMQRKSAPDLSLLTGQHFPDKAFGAALCQLPMLCGGREVFAEARKLAPALAMPGVDTVQAFDSALAELESVANAIAPRFPQVDIYFDLTELRGFSYHNGIVFAAYSAGQGMALANGGRYDDIGKVFGAARPATGFNTDIKALIKSVAMHDCSQNNGAGSLPEGAIAAPASPDPALWEKVCQLRAAGEIVFTTDDKTMRACARRLALQSDRWVLCD